MREFDVYVKKQLLEKFPSMVFFFVVTMIPNYGAKVFGIFFLILFSLASDVRQKRLDLLLYLPLTRKQIFWFEYLFLSLLISISFFVGLPFAERNVTAFVTLLKSLIFLWAYLSVVLSAVSVGFDPFAATFLFLLFDLVMSSIGTTKLSVSFNPYRFVSPLRQESVLASFIFAVGLTYVSYRLFTTRGGER